jgi:cell division septal protein FtsQ
MNHKIRRKYLFLIIPILLIVGGLGFFRYSDLFAFQKITIEPECLSAEIGKLNLPTGRNLFVLPVENAVDSLLAREKVYKIDLDYQLPDGIIIRVNDIRPIALVIGEDGRTRYRLGENSYLFPLDRAVMQYDFPIITGLKNCRAYTTSYDNRLKLIARQLSCLKEQYPDFYLAISSIDMSEKSHISVYLDGLPFRIDTYAGTLYKTIKNLKTFLLEFNPDLHDTKRLDMLSEGLIITTS